MTPEQSNCTHSLTNLTFMDATTYVGRIQIRQELEEGFKIPPPIVDWFFLALEQQQHDLRPEHFHAPAVHDRNDCSGFGGAGHLLDLAPD
jgi:hypothetical protein